MSQASQMIVGEHRRVYDERHRVALPQELVDALGGPEAAIVLAKEREGCVSLWPERLWNEKVQTSIELIRQKLQMNLLQSDLAKVQRFVRLFSTRARPVALAQRGRLLIPEGFRTFLGVEPNSEVVVVGAGVCVEIWHPEAWRRYLSADIENFNTLFKELVV
jgi:MraZ protein